jgi:hypothetical protein
MLSVQAQNALNVHTHTGSIQSTTIANIAKITFTTNTLAVQSKTGATQTSTVADVRKLTFDELYSPVIGDCTDIAANNYNPNATHNDGSCTYSTVAIATADNIHISVYPNPTTGIVFVSKASNIQVYTLQGVLIAATFGTSVDISKYPQDVYFVYINGKRFTIIKQ